VRKLITDKSIVYFYKYLFLFNNFIYAVRSFPAKNLYLAPAGQIGYLSLPADQPVTQSLHKDSDGLPRKAARVSG
jgi:hypothetical protein